MIGGVYIHHKREVYLSDPNLCRLYFRTLGRAVGVAQIGIRFLSFLVVEACSIRPLAVLFRLSFVACTTQLLEQIIWQHLCLNAIF